MSSTPAFAAISYDPLYRSRIYCKDQKEEPEAIQKQESSEMVYLNSPISFLPYSFACNVFPAVWMNWRQIEAQTYKKCEIVHFFPFSMGDQNVDIFGCGREKEFRFRKVEDGEELAALIVALAADILPADKVQEYVDEAIRLKTVSLDPETLKKLDKIPVPVGVFGLIHFYWLTHINDGLRYTSQTGARHTIDPPAMNEDLLITYPIHPAADAKKASTTAALLKDRFEITLGRSFNAVHIPKIPLEIYEPDTITSNFQTRD